MTDEDREEIRKIIAEEIVKNLNFDISSSGFESTGITIHITYDDEQLAYETL